MSSSPVVLQANWDAYSLLDCGGRRKLERFGDKLLIRGEPKAWWDADNSHKAWRDADAEISDAGGKWKLFGKQDRSWILKYGEIQFEARLTDMSKHVGVFPEQQPHWQWLEERLSKRERPRVLNLFGYTGAASLVSATAGAEVTHVDASKPAINWARHNQELSGMGKAPIRWILDDAFKFVAREVRRERMYDAVLLDPPSFGRGPKGELWKVEQQIGTLLGNIRKIVKPKGGMVVLTMYNIEASSLMLKCLMEDFFPGGRMEYGELTLGCSETARVLPLSLFARWES